ncbi:MAG: ATP-binding cassette domain-containing protein [Flavobacteriales bacterium]|nr:ATP-binding cassette domain-containing protein [Flavobacteriales bacterium]NNK80666.1 ATP-binding cassette domain-containing protein [Flavobacteriales bacterium]
MIELKDVHKSFDDSQIIKGVSTVFEKGKVNMIIGKSGSGKSVLTKCVIGLYKPTEGTVLFDGVEYSGMNEKQKTEIRKDIGMLFQASALFDSMTVLENVMFPLSMFTERPKDEMEDRAIECLKKVNIIDKEKLYPAETSGGMQKRIAIARAIAMEPQYLFADEPNSGLDPQTAIVIDNLLKEITSEYNTTTVVITHDMNSVMEAADNIMFIHEGHKWWEGNKEQLISTDNKELQDFVYASEFMKRLRHQLLKG